MADLDLAVTVTTWCLRGSALGVGFFGASSIRRPVLPPAALKLLMNTRLGLPSFLLNGVMWNAMFTLRSDRSLGKVLLMTEPALIPTWGGIAFFCSMSSTLQ